MEIKKATGVIEKFDKSKLINSLLKAGAGKDIAISIANNIEEKCVIDCINCPTTTEYVYKTAFRQLKQYSKVGALKFSLKRSLLELGPTGFPFEEFLAELYRAEGYSAITGQNLYGQCVPHEVDVVAWKKDELLLIEAKHHSDAGSRTDLKTVLYVKARFDDLRDVSFTPDSFKYNHIEDTSNMPTRMTKGVLITNTYFSETATTYALCQGVSICSFYYPEGDSLESRIIEHKLYPITCLTSITTPEKRVLLDAGYIHCRGLYKHSFELEKYGFSKQKIFNILDEVSGLLQ